MGMKSAQKYRFNFSIGILRLNEIKKGAVITENNVAWEKRLMKDRVVTAKKQFERNAH